jgi:hypothetical protein
MRKLLGLLLALALAVPVWPQAQPKPTPTPQATAPATVSGPCSSDYYRNSDGVCASSREDARLSSSTGRNGSMPGRELFVGGARSLDRCVQQTCCTIMTINAN